MNKILNYWNIILLGRLTARTHVGEWFLQMDHQDIPLLNSTGYFLDISDSRRE